MVRFINRVTGGEMWVHETRVEEYKAAGHTPAADTTPKPPKAAPKEPKLAGRNKK